MQFFNDPCPLVSNSKLLGTALGLFAFLLLPATSPCLGQVKPAFQDVKCEGDYQHHLQGVCVDDDAIYWSFTTTMVKTNQQGKILKQIQVPNHHGDLCYHKSRLYVAVNLGRFNDPQGNASSWVYVYDANTLELLSKQATPEVFFGAGGIGFRDGRFYVIGGLPNEVEENYVYEYDAEFQFVKKHSIKSGWTHLGIQTATFHDGAWWFGCYGTPKILLKTDTAFQMIGRYELDCSLGIVGIAKDQLLVAKGPRTKDNRHLGSLHRVRPDAKQGFVFLPKTVSD
ncbi:MAG: hypothetical protein ACKVH8_22900 [Pirellulales bacterium]|jgi:hypothetical protein